MNTAVTTDKYEFHNKNINAIIYDEMDVLPKHVYEEIFDVVENTDLMYILQEMGGMGYMTSTTGLGYSTPKTPQVAYQKAITRQNYRNHVVFESNIIETDKFDQIKAIASQFPDMIMQSRSLRSLAPLRNAPSYVLPNGFNLLDLNHINIGGGTYDTTFSDGYQKPFSYESVVELEQVIADQPSSANMVLDIPADKKMVIVVPFSLKEKAYEIAGVDNKAPADRPDTANRASNYFAIGNRFNVICTNHISTRASQVAGETTSSSTFNNTFYGLMNPTVTKKFWKLAIASGYEKGKLDEEYVKGNQSLVKYAYDNFDFGIVTGLGTAWSKGDRTTVS